MTQHLVRPSMFAFDNMIAQYPPGVVEVDGLDIVGVESVLVEENRTARKEGHMKAFLKDFVFDIVRSFL